MKTALGVLIASALLAAQRDTPEAHVAPGCSRRSAFAKGYCGQTGAVNNGYAGLVRRAGEGVRQPLLRRPE